MLKLKFQYFGHLMHGANSLEKTLMLGKIEGKRRGWQQRMRLDSFTHSMNMSLSKSQEIVEDSPRGHKESDMTGLLNSNPHTWNFQFAPYFIKRQNKYNS